jgi:hypothetical protein
MSNAYPWVPDAYCETHEWRSSTGETIRFVTRTGATQRFMPPVQIHTIKAPQMQGSRFDHARHDERLVTLPVVFPGPGAGRDELRRWAKALDPLKGEGTLTVVQGAHPGRQLVCVYEAGLEAFGEEYELLGLGTLAFRAAEPYWQDVTEHSLDAIALATDHHWFPFLPLILGPTDIFSSVIVDNPGDVDAWPIVTVLGPGQDAKVTNVTLGLSWTFEGMLNPGSTLVVDHRPGHKSARLDGANAFARLSDDSYLFPLAPGANHITIEFDNPTVDTRVGFTWRSRWLAA